MTKIKLSTITKVLEISAELRPLFKMKKSIEEFAKTDRVKMYNAGISNSLIVQLPKAVALQAVELRIEALKSELESLGVEMDND